MYLNSNGLESRRLKALKSYDIVDTPADPKFDHITRLVSLICEVPIALISFVDEKRQWVKSKYGIDIIEVPREKSFCNFTLEKNHALIIPDATRDPRFRNNQYVMGPPHVRFYAGIPLMDQTGLALGTLCAIDRRARTLSIAQLEALRVIAESIVTLMENDLRLQKLSLANATIRRLACNVSDGILLQDQDGTVTYCNETFQKMFDIPEAVIIGQKIHTVFYEIAKQVPGGLAELEQIANGPFYGAVRFETQRRKIIHAKSLPAPETDHRVHRVWIFNR